jgi:hypothetical protein
VSDLRDLRDLTTEQLVNVALHSEIERQRAELARYWAAILRLEHELRIANAVRVHERRARFHGERIRTP